MERGQAGGCSSLGVQYLLHSRTQDDKVMDLRSRTGEGSWLDLTYSVRCRLKLPVEAINEVVEVILIITDAIGVDGRSHAAQGIPKCQASCRAPAPACLPISHTVIEMSDRSTCERVMHRATLFAYQHMLHARRSHSTHELQQNLAAMELCLSGHTGLGLSTDMHPQAQRNLN